MVTEIGTSLPALVDCWLSNKHKDGGAAQVQKLCSSTNKKCELLENFPCHWHHENHEQQWFGLCIVSCLHPGAINSSRRLRRSSDSPLSSVNTGQQLHKAKCHSCSLAKEGTGSGLEGRRLSQVTLLVFWTHNARPNKPVLQHGQFGRSKKKNPTPLLARNHGNPCSKDDGNYPHNRGTHQFERG